jgi:hypothetical protein
MGVLDKLFKDDGSKPATRPTASTPASGSQPQRVNSSFPQTASYVPAPTFAVPSPGDDALYNKLLERTKLEGTQPYQQLNNFLMPLTAVITDPDLRLKAAFAQAQTTGLDGNRFMSAFDSMNAALDNERDGFSQTVDEQTRTINSKEEQISKCMSDIAELQQKITETATRSEQLRGEIARSKNKLESAKAQFSSAYERRKAEIANQRAQYTGLLK